MRLGFELSQVGLDSHQVGWGRVGRKLQDGLQSSQLR